MSLLKTRRFLPLFLTQFMGAFNDNMLKNALVMLVTYRIAGKTGADAQVLVTLAGAIFILPYFLFSATAGQCADKIDRARLTRIIKLVEIAIMALAAVGFILHSVWFLMFVLFAMGVHSTFFSPIKYAVLPQHLHDDELLAGNAYIESGSFLGILLGTILGGVLVLEAQGEYWVSAALMVVALAGYAASRYIPDAAPPEPDLVIGYNLWKETWRIVDFSRENHRVYRCILGISWFWLVGATFLSQFPAYVKEVLHAAPAVVTLFLTGFSVGIGAGSFLCNRLLKGHIKTTYVFAAICGISVFGIDLYFASLAFAATAAEATEALSIAAFLSQFSGWRILFDLFMIAVSAGVYIVPLYTVMQHDSLPQHRARIIAANNVVNALFMVGSALATLSLFAMSFSIPDIFLMMSLLNAVVAFAIRKL